MNVLKGVTTTYAIPRGAKNLALIQAYTSLGRDGFDFLHGINCSINTKRSIVKVWNKSEIIKNKIENLCSHLPHLKFVATMKP